MESTRNRQAEARALAGGSFLVITRPGVKQCQRVRHPVSPPPGESGPILIPIILVGNIDIQAKVSHALGMTTYDRTERRYVDLLRVASSRCRPIAS
jgi:hypothetical protein